MLRLTVLTTLICACQANEHETCTPTSYPVCVDCDNDAGDGDSGQETFDPENARPRVIPTGVGAVQTEASKRNKGTGTEP